MRPTKIIAAIFLFAIAFCGCKKEVIEDHPELVGEWYSEYYTSHGGSKIVFASDGSATYKEGVNADAKTYSGKAKIKNDKFKIGRADFVISAYPAYDSQGNYYFETDMGKYIGCLAVIDPTATVTGNTATFGWTRLTTPADLSDDKSIDYKPASSSSWITVSCSSSVNEYILTGLSPATTYEWRIKSVRGDHSSEYSVVQTFTTQ